jgi:putative FmdB family regulatory protein
MPFYEYECSSCKFYSEVMQKITDPPLKKCPSCGKNALRKLVSAPVFRLKGSGWYETDFKSDGERKRNLVGEDKAPESKPEATAESKTEVAKDAKGEPKTESKSDQATADKSGPGSSAKQGAGSSAAKSRRKGAPAPKRSAAKAKRKIRR